MLLPHHVLPDAVAHEEGSKEEEGTTTTSTRTSGGGDANVGAYVNGGTHYHILRHAGNDSICPGVWL